MVRGESAYTSRPGVVFSISPYSLHVLLMLPGLSYHTYAATTISLTTERFGGGLHKANIVASQRARLDPA